MKKYNNLFIYLILLIIISLVSGKTITFEEFKDKSFMNKIGYLYIFFFSKIEECTLNCIKIVKSYNIEEPYDFFFCFIIGCFLRIFYLIFKKIIKRIFDIKENNYVYNEPDNTEKLYEVNKKLNEFSKNLKNMKENENEDMNNINNENNIINNNNNNNTEIEKRIKIVNDKLAKLEKKMNDLNKDYEEEKNNIKINLKTIEECQKFIIDSMKSNEKDN